MGVYQTIYVGPFVECQNMEETYQKTLTGCPTCRKQKGREVKFCDKCSSAIGEFVKTSKRSAIEVEETFGDDFGLSPIYQMCPKKEDEYTDRFVPNQYRDEPRELRFDRDSDSGYTDIHQEKESEWLLDKFAPEIARLKAVYGEDRVKIRFGVAVSFN